MNRKLLCWLSPLLLHSQEQPFSGPQPGEYLQPFRVLEATGPHARREVDFVSEFGDDPTLLIFFRDIDRNVYRTLWPCDRYASGRAAEGLKTLFVYLTSDKVEGERRMQAVARSLSLTVPVAVSVDGAEGPGSYGLNKNVAVTALFARNRKVVHNRAIIQPGAKEAQQIIAELVKAVGGRVPSDLWLARGPSGTQAVTQEMLEGALAPDPPQLAEAFARMTPPQAVGPGVQHTLAEIRQWAGENQERRKYLRERIPTVISVCESEEARGLLLKLREDLAK
jgi:hypothetical protein